VFVEIGWAEAGDKFAALSRQLAIECFDFTVEFVGALMKRLEARLGDINQRVDFAAFALRLVP